ncbi:hypothetical protein LTR60_007604, partial [Cryomyces antarcticus]
MTDIPPYPLYGSTYTLHCLSPLYHGSGPLLEDAALSRHARRVRDLFKGDTVRGVDVGSGYGVDNSAFRNAGSLQDCTWTLLGDSASWEVEHRQSQEEHDSGVDAAKVTADNARGIHVQLHYEKSAYTVMLLRHPSTKSALSSKEFTSFPLLLTRMPAPLRELFLEYLATTFDTHVSPMRLRSDFLSTSLEQLLSHFPSAQSTQRVSTVVKAVQIQLTFPSAAPLLKNLDITLSADDVARFV